MVRRRIKNRKKTKKRIRAVKASPYGRIIGDIGVFFFTLLLGFVAVFAYFARDLPDTHDLWRASGQSKISILAADGSPIFVHGAGAGALARLADLPPYVPNAILAVEDRNFYHHFGVNPVSIARALIVNAREGEVRQGGSTITQQLAKNVFLGPDRTLKRKIQELMLALWLEHRFTKDEILTLYLNRVYFGAGAYGVDAASRRYFGKPASGLQIGEAAVLAGLLKAPSRFAPTVNPEDAGLRGRFVIDQMVEAGFLTRQEAEKAVASPIHLSESRFSAAPYFVDYVLHETKALTAGVDADLVVRTTFDPVLQDAAEAGLIAGLALAPRDPGDAEAAVVIIDREGAVRAMIGGRDYRKSQYNRAVQARRQPGSAFKPFVYLAALERGADPNDIVLDAPVRIGKWSPDNYKSRFFGEVTMREALARSLNSATVRVQEEIGRNAVRETARSMGWSEDLAMGPSLALGVDATSPLGLAGAYAPFANGGLRVAAHAIVRIETVDGDLVYRNPGFIAGEAAPASAIERANSMLSSVVEWGTGKAAAVPGYRVFGKTGTSQDNRDAWFAGHAGGLVAVAWIGRDDNQHMPGITGGTAPATIWREIMARALYAKKIPPDAYKEIDPIAALLQPGG